MTLAPPRRTTRSAGPTRADTAILLAVFVVARAISALLLVSAAPHQGALVDSPTLHVDGTLPASPGYWDVITNWDGQWYETIARHGYRTDPELFGPPAQRNELAFYPVYPLLVRGLMALTGLEFGVAAGLLSLAAGALGVVLLGRWLVRTRGRTTAHLAVAGLCAFPTAPVFQAAYTESLALLLLVVSLVAVTSRRYPLAVLAITVLGFTRPVTAPLAVLLALWAVRAWRAPRDDPRRADRAGLTATAVAAGAASAAWPVTVALMTGIPSAFPDTMQAWVKAGGVRGGWVAGIWQLVGPLAATALVVVTVAYVLVRARRHGRDRPPDGLWSWGAVYLSYVVLTTTIGTSALRYALLTLVPTEPVRRALTSALGRRPRAAVAAAAVVVLAVELAGQAWWVRSIFVISGGPGLTP